MHITYRPKGVCSQLMDIDVENGVIEKVVIAGGCSGNLQGISRLVVGMTVEDAVSRLEGIRCGFKPTSCPDQLAKALKKCMEN
ncbi:MAG: TIGR03905 family TSCPD domain-containing protein [Oscillospiraceae bacterium]|nr:TIGR03905 family TSCPD domain-containing protein [Oscillospiraceae bacterium]